MGIDMSAHVEVKKNDRWKYLELDSVFEYDDTRIYEWFGGCKFGHGIKPLIENSRGLPDDISDEVYLRAFGTLKRMPFDKASAEAIWNNIDHFGYSWLLLDELLTVDYNQMVHDLRANEEDMKNLSLGDFLGEMLEVIEKL